MVSCFSQKQYRNAIFLPRSSETCGFSLQSLFFPLEEEEKCGKWENDARIVLVNVTDIISENKRGKK